MRKELFLVLMLVIAVAWTTEAAAGDRAEAGTGKRGSVTASPAAPVNVRLKTLSQGFLLSWEAFHEDISAISGYEIYRSRLFNGPYDRIAVLDHAATEYLDASADHNAPYFYRILAVRGKAHSAFSNTVSGERDEKIVH